MKLDKTDYSDFLDRCDGRSSKKMKKINNSINNIPTPDELLDEELHQLHLALIEALTKSGFDYFVGSDSEAEKFSERYVQKYRDKWKERGWKVFIKDRDYYTIVIEPE